MELMGKLRDLTRDLRNDTFLLTLEIKEIPPGVDRLPEKLRITLARWTNKRSVTANAYYWVLVSKIADRLSREGKPVSKPFVHNWMLCDYGQPEIIDGKPVYVSIKESAAAHKDVLESTEYHLKATGYVYVDRSGDLVRDYMMLKNSRVYDSEEMARLIDGTVEEAKALGIETLPPAELERMMQEYEIDHNK